MRRGALVEKVRLSPFWRAVEMPLDRVFEARI
jgi:hypothetical protein